MSERKIPASQANTLGRRQIIGGLAITIGGLAAGSDVFGEMQQQTVTEHPSTATNQKRTFLHQEVTLAASPQRIYEVLLDSKQFAAFTGMPAEIDPKAGGAFTTFAGLIAGRNVELIPNQRIVQAWRPTHWDSGVYSIVKFELKSAGSGTLLVLDHTGFPEGEFDSLDSGWKMRYWDPMKKFLARASRR